MHLFLTIVNCNSEELLSLFLLSDYTFMCSTIDVSVYNYIISNKLVFYCDL